MSEDGIGATKFPTCQIFKQEWIGRDSGRLRAEFVGQHSRQRLDLGPVGRPSLFQRKDKRQRRLKL